MAPIYGESNLYVYADVKGPLNMVVVGSSICFGGDSIQYDCDNSAQYGRDESNHNECESPIDMCVV